MTTTSDDSWNGFLDEQAQAPYWSGLKEFVRSERTSHQVYPEPKQVLRAFKEASLSATKVVIIGQDPYHGPGQANGLAFSVNDGTALPPSLRNIYKELEADLGIARTTGDLGDWASQGVMLLNTTLTVRQSQPTSHRKQGWEELTDAAIRRCAAVEAPMVYILWGSHARSKKALVHNDKHLVIESPHPSPLSAHRGFFGSKPFSKTNDYLVAQGLDPIVWG